MDPGSLAPVLEQKAGLAIQHAQNVEIVNFPALFFYLGRAPLEGQVQIQKKESEPLSHLLKFMNALQFFFFLSTFSYYFIHKYVQPLAHRLRIPR